MGGPKRASALFVFSEENATSSRKVLPTPPACPSTSCRRKFSSIHDRVPLRHRHCPHQPAQRIAEYHLIRPRQIVKRHNRFDTSAALHHLPPQHAIQHAAFQRRRHQAPIDPHKHIAPAAFRHFPALVQK